MPGLTPDQVQKIHQLIHNKQIIQAIQVYQQATGVGLAEAKSAVEEMAQNEFVKPQSGVRDYDNPVLESKIKSLLGKKRKIDAIKIYREEYGVGLKEAKDAVERIEATMISGGISTSLPYEPAIGSDPFAENTNPGRSIVLLISVIGGLVVCGAAVLIFLLNS